MRDDVVYVNKGDFIRGAANVKSIIKPTSKWQPKTVSVGDNETVVGKEEQTSTQRKNSSGSFDFIPCYNTAAAKSKGRSVHYDEEDIVISYEGEGDEDSYSDDSTKALSFVSENNDNYLRNLVTDYLKNRLIHLHTLSTSPPKESRAKEGDNRSEHAIQPFSLQARVTEDEGDKSTCYLEDDFSSYTSGASTMTFDSREKYSSYREKHSSYHAKCNDCISIVGSEPSYAPERYSVLKNAAISLEYPSPVPDDHIETFVFNEPCIHSNTIASDMNNGTFFLSSDPIELIAKPYSDERYALYTANDMVRFSSLDDSFEVAPSNIRYEWEHSFMSCDVDQKLDSELETVPNRAFITPFEAIADQKSYPKCSFSTPHDTLNIIAVDDQTNMTFDTLVPHVEDQEVCRQEDSQSPSFITCDVDHELETVLNRAFITPLEAIADQKSYPKWSLSTPHDTLNIIAVVGQTNETFDTLVPHLEDQEEVCRQNLDLKFSNTPKQISKGSNVDSQITVVNMGLNVDNSDHLKSKCSDAPCNKFPNKTGDENMDGGSTSMLKELALLRYSLHTSELLGPLHRVTQLKNK